MNFFLFFGLFVSLLLPTVQATVTMPSIFGDHMVLQQGVSLPIWGEATPGEQVIVHFVGQVVTTTAAPDGHWRVNLKPVYLRSSPDILTVDGENRLPSKLAYADEVQDASGAQNHSVHEVLADSSTGATKQFAAEVEFRKKSDHLEFSDVIMGDVWLCSGQSNMAFPLEKADRSEEAIAQASDDGLRFFVVTERRSLQPQHDLEGRWERCTPESASTFSAVGYFFARDVRKATGMPLGLIGSYCNNSPAQAWMSLKALKEAPSFSHYLADYESVLRNFSEASASYSQQKEEYQNTLATWEKEVGASYEQEIAAWKIKCKEACARLQAQPLKPESAAPKPQPPLPPDGGVTCPTVLFNGMIAPLIPYAITGVLWYQGESNQGAAAFEYRRLFQRLIRSWRAAWGEGPFPFYFVSLAGFYKPSSEPVEMLLDEEGSFNPAWAWVREGQAAALSLPETGMAVATDLGNPYNIHPADKLDVGRRLALLARKNVYSESLVATGPVYRAMTREGSKIRLAFDHVGKGLTIAAPPWRYDDTYSVPLSLKGFSIAGDDRHWQDAVALIVGNEVIVSSEIVKKPTAVRYNWANNPSGNLYNKEGLPAASFRTDNDQP